MTGTEKIIFDLFHVSIAAPILVGLIFYRRLNTPLRILLLLFILSATAEAINPIFGRLVGAIGPLFNVYGLLETLLCSLFFYKILPASKGRTLIAIATLLFLLYGIGYNIFVPGKFMRFNQTILGGIGAVVLAWVLLYFTEIIKDLQKIRLDRDPYFFISIGMLFCFTSLILVYFGFKYLPEGTHVYTTYKLSWIARIILNLLVAYGFYLHSKQWIQSKSTSS